MKNFLRGTNQIGAVKILMRNDAKAISRFRREASLLADTFSPAFPRFYGAGEHGGRTYLAIELLESADLPSSDAAVARYILGVCAGVQALHRRGYVHRDIKPRNVMRRPSTGEPVLIDMGLAKEANASPQTISDTLSVVARSRVSRWLFLLTAKSDPIAMPCALLTRSILHSIFPTSIAAQFAEKYDIISTTCT